MAARATLDHTPLRRPPIRQSTMVRSDVEHTFTVFVRGDRHVVADGHDLRGP